MATAARTLGADEQRHRTIVDGSPPEPERGVLLYQTLSAPGRSVPRDEPSEGFAERIATYMLKALREAKVYTSWLNPSGRHEDAMTASSTAVLRARRTRGSARTSVGLAAAGGAARDYNIARAARVKIARPACPTSTRAPSCGISASSIRTTAAPSITRSASVSWRRLPQLHFTDDEGRDGATNGLTQTRLSGCRTS